MDRQKPNQSADPAKGVVMSKTLTNDRAIRAAKAANGKPEWFPIGGARGLRLCVMPSGHKSWSSTIYPGGKKTHVKLGDYSAIGLADAKDKHIRLRLAVADGRDPAKERKAAKAEAAYTFGKLAAHYLERHAKLKKRSWENDVLQLNATILPALGGMAADKISRRDIIAVLDKKAFGEDGKGGHGVAANRAQALISAIFTWAVNEDLMPANPAHGIKPRVDEAARERTLSPDEMRAFWHGIECASMIPAVRDVLRLALLTGQRISEISGAEASEFDWMRKLWTIPGARTKNKKTHILPLAPLACAMFEAAFQRSECRYAFASRALEIRPIKRSAATAAWGLARKALGLGDVHIHDLRRSTATQLGEMNFSDFDIGLVLNHTRAGVTQVYNRGEYNEKKLHMLGSWEGRLSAILEGREPASNAVPLRKA
jgi:integrase